MNCTVWSLLATIASVFVAAYTQGVTGFGFGIVAMALLPLFGDARQASVLIGVLSLASTVTVFWSVRTCLHWRDMVYPLAGMAVGVPLGVYALTVLDEQSARRFVALVVLFAALQVSSSRLRPRGHIASGWGTLAGVIGGVLGGAFGMGGPPVIAYATMQDWDGGRYKAMLCSYFTISNAYRLVLLISAGLITKPLILTGAAALPALFLGSYVGILTFGRLSRETFRKAVAATLVVLALTLLIL